MIEVLKKHILVQLVEWCSKQQSYALPLTFSSCGANSASAAASVSSSTPATPATASQTTSIAASAAVAVGAGATQVSGMGDGFHSMPELLEQNLNRDLDKLQSWCESLCDSVLRTRQQVLTCFKRLKTSTA